MLSVNGPRGTSLERINFDAGGEVPDRAVWLDLCGPTLAENKRVERALGIALPTREEMQEIEVTSRLYVENGARYMTATLMCHSDSDVPRTTPVTFNRAPRRPYLEGAREPGLDRPAFALSCRRGRHHEVGEGPARRHQGHAARRAIAVRPRHLSIAVLLQMDEVVVGEITRIVPH